MVHRIEVRPKPGHTNPKAEAVCRDAESLGIAPLPSVVHQADVYLIEGDLTATDLDQIAHELLADPVTQAATIGHAEPSGRAYIEVQPLPGVMDPAASAVELAIRAAIGADTRVQTGSRYDFFDVDQHAARIIAERALANTVIHAIHDRPVTPSELPKGEAHDFEIVSIPLRDLNDGELERLSRDAHLFLSLDEMRAIQEEYRALGREPREIELETIAQTWSEHCVHKTLKSRIRYRETPGEGRSIAELMEKVHRPGHARNADGSITIDNLLKSTVAAATEELIEAGVDWCLSVFVDNAGVIAFDDDHAVCFKCETHNHPSAIEPYGGAATGIGGCIRDIMGTGLAAKPIAATDVFCVAHPDRWTRDDGSGNEERVRRLPAGCLHPRRILQQIVAGVRDYGNRMGIPTLNGAVWFDDRYVGNPLVYCGCIGVMPRDRVKGDPHSGDRIIALGGRTGRDGIHGATFSSAELTDTHADEFAHAVQIGNPITQKATLDAILEMAESKSGCLFNAITDCGAGGFSSAVGEMGEHLGAYVTLENAPLKYAGLSPTEIWISEAQERMVLAVSQGHLDSLRAICDKHDVEMCDLGHFGTDGAELILTHNDIEVGRMPMDFLHNGIPQTTREATWHGGRRTSERTATNRSARPSVDEALRSLLAHPNIASKHWIIRQYDHEVQGNTVAKPLVGEHGIGPGDAAVVTPVEGSNRGVAIANGLATGFADDPYEMTLLAIDECVRNLVCVGTDPDRIAILDNFCWPSCGDPENLGALVRAAEACYDGAKAYRTPFISGKDSLNNQFTTEAGETIQIPPTLLISGIGIVPDVRKCISMDAKRAANMLVLVGGTRPIVRGSHFEMLYGDLGDEVRLRVDVEFSARMAQLVASLISAGLVVSAHDVSDGGLLCAVAEMCLAGGFGADLDGLASHLGRADAVPELVACFGEGPGTYILEVRPDDLDSIGSAVVERGCAEEVTAHVGTLNDSGRLTLGDRLDVSISELRAAWRGTLDW